MIQNRDRILQPVSPHPAMSLITIYINISGQQIPALIDTGSEGNCIQANVWRELGGTIDHTNQDYIVTASGQPLNCLGEWNTQMKIGDIEETITLSVIEGINVYALLGRSWQHQLQLRLQNNRTATTVHLTSSDGRHTYEAMLTAGISPYVPPQYLENPQESSLQEIGISVIDFQDSHLLALLMDTPNNPPLTPLRPDTPDGPPSTQPRPLNWGFSSPEPDVSSDESRPTSIPPARPKRKLYRRKKYSPPALSESDEYIEPSIQPHQPEDWGEELDLDINPQGDLLTHREMSPITEASVEGIIFDEIRTCKHLTCLGGMQTGETLLLEDITFQEAEELIHTPKMTDDYEESCFILKNTIVKIDGKYREGHGMLQIAYFPHMSERVRIAYQEEVQPLPPSDPRSELTINESIYTSMRRFMCGIFGGETVKAPPQLISVDIHLAEKLKGFFTLTMDRKEDQFLARNIFIKIGQRYREGHGFLRMVYFPYESERVKNMQRAAEQDDGSDSSVDIFYSPELPPQRITEGLTLDDMDEVLLEIDREQERSIQHRRSRAPSPSSKESSTTMLTGTQDSTSELEDTNIITEHQVSNEESSTSENIKSGDLQSAIQNPKGSLKMIAALSWGDGRSSGWSTPYIVPPPQPVFPYKPVTSWIPNPMPDPRLGYQWNPVYSPPWQQPVTPLQNFTYPPTYPIIVKTRSSRSTPYSFQLADGTTIMIWPKR